MPKLYEMTEAYLKLQEEDIDPDQLKDCLESIEDAVEEKGSNIVSLINNWQGDIDAIDLQVKRLQAMKKSLTNKQDNLKEYLRYNMEQTGISKIEHPLFKITLRKPSKVVSIVDEAIIPDEFMLVKTDIKPDLIAIKKALKEGAVEGVELIDGKSSLLIK